MYLATPMTVVYFDQRTKKLFNRMEPNLQHNFKWTKEKKKKLAKIRMMQRNNT